MANIDKLRKKRAANLTDAGVSSRQDLERTGLSFNTKVAGANYRELEISAIRFNPNNDYKQLDTPESIARLAEDIHRNGLLHNMVVSTRQDGQHILLSGERRLRALQLLAGDPERNADGRYNKAMVKCVYGLDPVEEMLCLDAANLQARGSLGDEAFTRKVVGRYMENLKARYGLTEAQARAQLKQDAAGIQDRTIYRVLQINADLIPPLTRMLDEKTITRFNAIDFCAVGPELQEVVARELERAGRAVGEGRQEVAQQYTAYKNELAQICRSRRPDKEAALCQATQAFIDHAKDLLDRLGAAKEDPRPEAVIPAMAKKRAKYVERYAKLARELEELSNPRKAKALLGLERAEGEGSIVGSLEQLARELDRLLDILKEQGQ